MFFTVVRPATPSLVWWTTHGLEKVRPYDRVPDRTKNSAQISAARNEFEPFQIVLRADSQGLTNVDVEVSDLKGPRGAAISRKYIGVYLEHYIDLEFPSSIEGRAGEWPDALIPRVDAYFGEKRNAFPFALPDGRNQPIWFDVYVPQGTPPGDYAGEVLVTVGGKPAIEIPMKLHVWNFSLPSTSSLPTSFGFNGVSALKQHRGKYTNDDDLFAISHLYRKSALLHRISVHGGSMAPPRARSNGGRVEVDWRFYDAEVGPFLNGTALSTPDPLPGARATTIRMQDNLGLRGDDQYIQYYREYARHFREKGWFDRLFYYLWDEPKQQHSSELVRRGKLVHAADPHIRNLLTASLHEDWRGVVDIWTPLVNCFERKSGFNQYCHSLVDRAGYEGEQAEGKSLWWYQSCSSHGCEIVGGEYFRGWPSYMIDHSGVSNRIMSWLTWKYDIGGELYFNLDEAFARKKDPWIDVRLFGGNGDGTLFYPGQPARIGGRSDIPVESIRLKLVREGLEDYEYLVMLSAKAGPERTAELVNSLVRSAYDYKQSPEMLYGLREQVAKELSQ